MVSFPEPGECEVFDRVRPNCVPSAYMAYGPTKNGVNALPAYGEGYRWYATGLTHDARGFPTDKPDEVVAKLDKLRDKIEDYESEVCRVRAEYMDDAEIAVVSYGSVSRTALQVVNLAREAGVKVGYVQLQTVWPFPVRQLRDLLGNTSHIIVAELNMGQIVGEVERVAPAGSRVHSLLRYDGDIFTPMQFLEKIQEVRT
jgi:2-oxoglutarate ferredoxin oxidoreductase subunit alpha